MQIHDLNTKALTNPAYVAFDDGTDTYKADFKAEIDNAAADAVADAVLTDNTVAFTSGDAASPTAWTNVSVITSGSTLATLFNRISTMVKNVRYLWALIGSSSFQNVASTLSGAIGNTALTTTATTLSGAIAEHETDISTLNGKMMNDQKFYRGTAASSHTFTVPNSSCNIFCFDGKGGSRIYIGCVFKGTGDFTVYDIVKGANITRSGSGNKLTIGIGSELPVSVRIINISGAPIS